MSIVNMEKSRKRNLLIKLTNLCNREKTLLKSSFTIQDINNNLYFRKSDIANYLNDFFVKEGDKYSINQETSEKITKYINKHDCVKGKYESSSERYKKKFECFRKKYTENINTFNFQDEYPRLYSKIEEDLEVLHWYILPEYSEQMLINSRMIPEEDIKEYYNNYHALEDLYEASIGKGISIESLKGDLNLDKELKFKVFSRRWGHDDIYTVERRTDGWYASHIAESGTSEKDGTGALLKNLKHDLISFPEEGIKYALNQLWNMADEREMSVDELQIKLQEIADWISEVEKTVGEYQPSWVNYY